VKAAGRRGTASRAHQGRRVYHYWHRRKTSPAWLGHVCIVLERPRDVMTIRPYCISRFGFAWFGGSCRFVVLRFWRAVWNSGPELHDLCSRQTAVGYAIGRIGCVLVGDGGIRQPHRGPGTWGMAFPDGSRSHYETCVQWGWAGRLAFTDYIYEIFHLEGHRRLLSAMGKHSIMWRAAKGEIPLGLPTS